MPKVFFVVYLDKLYHEKKDGVVCNPVLNRDKKRSIFQHKLITRQLGKIRYKQ